MRRIKFRASYTAFELTTISFSFVLENTNIFKKNCKFKVNLLFGILARINEGAESSESTSLSTFVTFVFLSFSGNESAKAFNGKTVDFSSLQFSEIVK